MQQAGRPEEPVHEIARRAAEEQPQGDRPRPAPQAPGNADDPDEHSHRDQRVDHCVRGTEIECGPRVAVQAQGEQSAQQDHLVMEGQIGHG